MEKKSTTKKKSKGRIVWSVVCGAIRDELELRLVLDELLRMRSEETIQGIVISTWKGDFDSFPQLRKEIEKNNIEIIEQVPLDNRVQIGRTNSVNYLRQAMQMQKALDQLPEDCFVLKARTDRSLTHLKQIKPYVKKRPTKIRNRKDLKKYRGILPEIFEYPLTIFNAKTQRIIHFSDFVLYGHINDVRKIVNFNIPELYLDRDLVANTQWFVYPFLEKLPIIRDYFRLINFRPLITGMRDSLQEKPEADAIPRFFYRVYGTYLMVLDNYFELVDFTNELSEETAYHFFDLFINAKDKGISFTMLGSALLSDQVVDNLLDLEKLGTTKSDQLFKEVLKDNQIIRRADSQEYQEMRDFRENGWFKEKNWLRVPNWRPIVEPQAVNYQESLLDYRFEELSEEETNDLLEELKVTDSIDRHLYHYWLNNSNLGAKAAEEMILPFARTQNQDGVLLVSRLLRLGKIMKPENIASIKHLITVTSNIQIQRKTANIKTYQMMLNLFLTERSEEEFNEIYRTPSGQRIVRHYLTSSEYDEVQRNEYSKQALIEFLYKRSEEYETIGKTVLSLRLEEIASEIALSKESTYRIHQRYLHDNNKRNITLSKRTLSFF
ncbi:hypothetical protein KQI58_00800 [Enterococcus raffinosus]|uniref:hypothetical protein n=1 Tax=Enterococcus raffinosus TaxID=71452 RepID=UPI001C102696|nr:hypothetical protein [Enterococcus raffinosus]MBU5359608.1 hypothetical protein [Enterococcus raffinosus]